MIHPAHNFSSMAIAVFAIPSLFAFRKSYLTSTADLLSIEHHSFGIFHDYEWGGPHNKGEKRPLIGQATPFEPMSINELNELLTYMSFLFCGKKEDACS